MVWMLYFVDLATARGSFAMAVPVNKFNNLNISFISIEQYSFVIKQAEAFR